MDVVEYIPINWGLVRHPANWVIIFLMVVIAGFAVEQIIKHFNSQGVVQNA